MPTHSTFRIIVIAIIVFIALTVSSAWFFASHLTTPGYIHQTPEQGLHPRDAAPFKPKFWMGMHGDPQQELGLAFETVEFDAIDGSTLRGWLIPSSTNSKAAVIAAHGGESDRRSFMRHVPMLHRAGYPVLLFDYREHGISDGDSRGIAFGWRAHHDVSSAVTFMKQKHQFAQIAVIGTSMGAVSAIIATANNPNIDVVIAENPFASAVDVLGDADFFDKLPTAYHQLVAYFVRQKFDAMDEPDAIDVVADIAPRPLLLMHGTKDKAVSLWQSKALYKKAGQPKDFWILDGAEHTALFNHSPEEYELRVVGFLNKYLHTQ